MNPILFSVVFSLRAITPVAIDTPPPMPIKVAKLSELKTEDDLRAVALLDNGRAAPRDLIIPFLKNRREVLQFLVDNYPALLRSQEKTLTAYAWMHIDRTGSVTEMTLAKSSGDPEADAFAMKALRVVRFAPAMVVSGDSVGVWLPYPLDIASYSWLQRELARPDVPRGDDGTPRFTPYTVKPELINRNEVSRALVQNYPTSLRNVGIGGRTVIWIFVNTEGRVVHVGVKESSGYAELDEAAVKVGRIFRFTPARNRDQVVPVWIALPITFKTQ